MRSMHGPSCALLALALAGCHGARPEKNVYVEATRTPTPPKPVVREVEVPVPTPQLRVWPRSSEEMNEPASPAEAIAEAKKNATQRASPDGFIEAAQVYDYLPGVVYEVIASPGHLTTILLEPGETLVAKAAGDTARWSVADARTGSHAGGGGGERVMVLIKPLKPGVSTNLVLATDRRVYQIDLRCPDANPPVYHSEVRWNYPQDLALSLASSYRAEAGADDDVLDAAVSVSDLDFGYRVRQLGKGNPPRWTPKRVFTDGRKTYIAFPHDLDATDAPPLFVLSDKDEAQLVNYRIAGTYYIVDRVIERAELRLGEAQQRIVRIEREDADHRANRGRDVTRGPRRR